MLGTRFRQTEPGSERRLQEDIRISLDLVMALGGATELASLPTGDVVAGMAIGPHVPGLLGNGDRAMQLVNFVPACLMFTIVTELSLRKL